MENKNPIIDLSTLLAEASSFMKDKKAETKKTSRKWAAGQSQDIPNPLQVHQFAWRPTHCVLVLQTTVCACCGWSIRVSRGMLIREVHPRTHAVRHHQRPTLDWRKLPKATRDLPVATVYGCDYCFYQGNADLPHDEEPLDPRVLLGKSDDEIKIDKFLGSLGLGGIDSTPAKAGPAPAHTPFEIVEPANEAKSASTPSEHEE